MVSKCAWFHAEVTKKLRYADDLIATMKFKVALWVDMEVVIPWVVMAADTPWAALAAVSQCQDTELDMPQHQLLVDMVEDMPLFQPLVDSGPDMEPLALAMDDKQVCEAEIRIHLYSLHEFIHFCVNQLELKHYKFTVYQMWPTTTYGSS